MASITALAYAPPAVLPYPIGLSPFRQKGNAYLNDIRCYDAILRGGFAALRSALADERARTFFSQPFRASDWYDAYPGAVIESTAARLRGVRFERHRREVGAWHAENVGRGMYGALLRVVSNETVGRWAPAMAGIYFEFVRVQMRVDTPGRLSGELRGIPSDLVQWLTWASLGFCERSLLLAGARTASAQAGDVAPDGVAHGRELSRVGLITEWT